MLILKALQSAPMHGFGISVRIRQISADVLQVEQGSLYPALYRLEEQGWIKASGAFPRTIGGPASMKSRGSAANNLTRDRRLGTALPRHQPGAGRGNWGRRRMTPFRLVDSRAPCAQSARAGPQMADEMRGALLLEAEATGGGSGVCAALEFGHVDSNCHVARARSTSGRVATAAKANPGDLRSSRAA